MKSVLVIIFNRDYSKNIPKLEQLYAGRFAHIIYLVPNHSSRFDKFYDDKRISQEIVKLSDKAFNMGRKLLGKRNSFALDKPLEESIKGRLYRAVGHQFYFYDFITQVSKYLLSLQADWYWFVGDDALLHPRIDEETIVKKIVLTAETDCVLCRPVIGSDKWIGKIAGSVEDGEKKLMNALGKKYPVTLNHKINPESGAMKNTRIPVACADFFGFNKDILRNVLQYFKKCFINKIYVEIALPNSLLAASQSPLFLDYFIWDGTTKPGDWERLYLRMIETNSIFAHPIKLSAVPDEKIDWLRTDQVARKNIYGA
jgi:hypothetical protein